MESQHQSQYELLKQLSSQIEEILCDDLLTPVAKAHFEADRGVELRKVLPDKSNEYAFESHGFYVLIHPERRELSRFSYQGRAISEQALIMGEFDIEGLLEDGRTLWMDTFGEYNKTEYQAKHPGPFPIEEDVVRSYADRIEDIRKSLHQDIQLETVAILITDGQHKLLGSLFDTPLDDILSPGGDDLSTIIHQLEDIHIAYNDGDIAVFRPIRDENRRERLRRMGETIPERGLILGRDDTPTGLFAHVTDVTNLGPNQSTTHDAIRDAMGFDAEIDPENPPSSLSFSGNGRVRLQGDLRIERIGAAENFPELYGERFRQEQVETLLEDTLQDIDISPLSLFRANNNMNRVPDTPEPVFDLLNFSISTDDLSVGLSGPPNFEITVLSLVKMHTDLDVQPMENITEPTDIPGIMMDPTTAGNTGKVTTEIVRERRDLLDRLFRNAQTAVENILDPDRKRIKKRSREVVADAKSALEISPQANLPIDNHLAFIKDGFVPDEIEEEPIPIMAPEETTLHLEHSEHNTITIDIPSGVYRFSLLPRGLQPEPERPTW